MSWGWFLLASSPLLLRLVFTRLETNLWGLNSLAFTSNQLNFWIILLTLFFFGALLFERLKKRSILQDVPRRLPSLTSRLVSLLIAVSFGLIALILASDSHLFGDGYALIGALAQSDELYAHPMSYLATKTVATIYLLFDDLGGRALDNSALAISALTAICGAVSVWVWLRIARKLSNGKTEQLLLFSTALLSGASLVFFGEGEFYSPAILLVSLILLSHISMIHANTSVERYRAAGALALLSILAPFYLAQLIFILPATVFMLGIGLAPGPKRERIWGELAVLTLVAIVVALYWQAQSDLWIQARIVELSGKPPEFDYSLFSLRRLFDLLNTSFVLWPLFPLTAWLCLRYVWRERCDHIVGGLTMLTLSFAVWIFISDFPGGSAREITTVAMFSLPASLLAAYLWVKRFRDEKWFGRTTVSISILAVLSFSALAPVYIDGEAGVKYLDHDYQNRKDRYLNGLVDFRDHYYFQQEFAKADQWEWSFSRKSPAYLDHRSIKLMFNKGDYSATLNRLALLMTTNPYWASLYPTKAAALQSFGRNAEALAVIDSGLQLSPGDISMLAVRGNIFGALKKPDSAMAMYMRALRYDSHNVTTRKDLGLFYINTGNSRAAEKEGYLIFEDNPNSSYSFLLVGLAAFDRQEYDRARKYLTMAVTLGNQIPETEIARIVLDRIQQLNIN